jgi:hypothetical protein
VGCLTHAPQQSDVTGTVAQYAYFAFMPTPLQAAVAPRCHWGMVQDPISCTLHQSGSLYPALHCHLLVLLRAVCS